jgi:hypothetical protein
MAEKGLERVKALYTWEQKALQINEVYKWVCHDREEIPAFPFIPIHGSYLPQISNAS